MPTSNQLEILIALVFFSVACFAQGEKANSLRIDSLKKALATLHETERVDCLNELSGSYISLNRGYFLSINKDSAKYYAASAYAEAQKINYIHGMAEAKSLEVETAGEDFPTAEKFAREAINLYENTSNKKRLAKTYYNLGYALWAQSMFAEAIDNFKISYELFKKDNDPKGLGQSLLIIAGVYEESGDYEKAFGTARKVLDMAIANHDDWLRRIGLTLIGTLFRDIEDYSTAIAYYRQALQNLNPEEHIYNTAYIRPVREIAETYSLRQQYDSARYYFSFVDTSNERSLRFYLVSLGEDHFLQKEYNQALPNFIRALAYHKQSNDRNQVMRTLIDIAKTQFALHENTAALARAREALTLANQTGAKKVIRNGYQILHSIYDRLKNPDSAYFYYREFVRMNDSVITDQVKGKLVAYNYEQRIELMNQEKVISQQQLNIQHQRLKSESLLRNILIAGILAVLLLGIIMFGNFALKRKNEKLENERTKAELKNKAADLEMQALRAQMNPHFIFNSLNSINRFILQNNRAEASEYLIKFSKLVRLILQNSQVSLITLDSELESLELYLDLEALRFDYHFEHKISVPEDLDIEEVKVPPLIIQPYVENAIWHGLMHKEGKGQLGIEVSQENGYVFFKITDNGIGRKQTAALASKSITKHKSMGLRITADRITMMQNSNGSESPVTINDLVNTDGSPAGTEVIIKMPLIYD